MRRIYNLIERRNRFYLSLFILMILCFPGKAQTSILKQTTNGCSLPNCVSQSQMMFEKQSSTTSLWNLGIGTNSPGARLHIQNSSFSTEPAFRADINYLGTMGATVQHLVKIGSQSYGIYESSADDWPIMNYFNDPVKFRFMTFSTTMDVFKHEWITTDPGVNSITYIMNSASQGNTYPLIIKGNGIVVQDTLVTNSFKLPTNAHNNYLLVSDALGNGTWKNPLDFYDLTWKRTANDDLWSNCTNNVGIGTKTPMDKFQVNDGSLKVAIGRADARDLNYGNGYLGFNAARQVIDSQPQWTFNSDGLHNGGSVIWSNMTGTIYFAPVDAVDPLNMNQSLSDQRLFSNVKMAIYSNGKVAIGTDQIPGDHTLYVKGGILTEEIVVKLLGDWSDYVFSSSYKKLPLPELENYINTNHHLPDIPTENEIKSQGLDVGKMNALLVKKVEELSLYVIELQKQIDELKKSQGK